MQLETERLTIRRMTQEDAPFILRLLNEASFLHFIGDKGVRNLDEARRYIESGPIASYEHFGFGLYLVQCKASGDPAGMCGLIRRDTLEDVDLGFAFVPQFWSRGFAGEACEAVLQQAWNDLRLQNVVAVTAVDNERSISLLQRLGFRYVKVVRPFVGDEPLRLYALLNPGNQTD